MEIPVVVMLVLSWTASLWLLYRLHSRPGYWLEKLALTGVLLVPFLGWLAYLFLVENVPPQHEDLKNRGPRGFYTDHIISRTRPGPEEPSIRLEMWADAHGRMLAARGCRVVHRADERSASMNLDSDTYVGTVVLWPGGDYEVQFLSADTGEVVLMATGLQWERDDLTAVLKKNGLI